MRFRRKTRLAMAVVATVGAAALPMLPESLLSPAAVSPAVSAAPPAVAVACGTTLTASVTLTADLTCTGTALRAGANGITVNLNGHTLRGNGTGAGVYINVVDGVTVRNGRIDRFLVGVRLDGSANSNRIQDLRVTRGKAGIVVFESSSNVLTANQIYANQSSGAVVQGGANNQVTNNLVTGTTSGDGIRLIAGSGDASNVISGNKVVSSRDAGIRVETGGRVLQNVTNGNGSHGIWVTASDSAPATLTSNTANYNTGLGFKVNPGAVVDGGGNKAHGNSDLHQCENLVCP